MEKEKMLRRKQRSIDEKYEIIKFYEMIESTGRGAKEKTRQEFGLPTISSLNTILHSRDDIMRIYESNQNVSTRVRLTSSRFPKLDQQLYNSFAELSNQKSDVADIDITVKAAEIRDKLLTDHNLSKSEKSRLSNFKATTGFIKGLQNFLYYIYMNIVFKICYSSFFTFINSGSSF